MMKSTCVVKCLAMMGLISCVAMTAQADDAPAYRWLFEANPSINAGSASGVSLNLGNGVTLHDGYAAFQAVSGGKAGWTSSPVDLSEAQAITVSFFLRNPVWNVGDSSILIELGEDYNAKSGRFLIAHTVEDGADKIGALICVDPSGKRYSNVDAKGLQLRDENWHHIAIVYRTGCDYPKQAAIYVDGTNVTLSTRTGSGTVVENKPTTGVTFPSADTLYVCGRAGVAARTMDLADISIFKRELTAKEVYGLSIGTQEGLLFVEQTDAAPGTSSPALGAHQGYQAGDVVPFSWTKADASASEDVRGWMLWTNDAANVGAWGVWKRGFGNCGSFVHTGGQVNLIWTTGGECEPPTYKWGLDSSPSSNEQSADVKMTFSAGVDVSQGYAAFTGAANSSAVTSDDIDLRDASAITLAFSLRNPDRKNGSVLIEQSPNYSNCDGSFLITCKNGDSQTSRNLELCLRIGNGLGFACVDATNVPLADGEWHDIVIIYRKADYPGCMSLYIDGREVALTRRAGGQDPNVTASPTGAFAFAKEKLYLGGRNGTGVVAADLRNFAVYKRELSVAEIQGGVLLTTAKRDEVTGAHLPIAPFGSQCAIREGEVLSFAFADDRLHSVVDGKTRKLASWTVYRQIGNAWESYLTGAGKSFEFTCPSGNLKLELDFAPLGFAVLLK